MMKMKNKLNTKTVINDAVKIIDKYDWGTLDILAEYLYCPSWIEQHLDEDNPSGKFHKLFKAINNLDLFGREAIQHYVMYRKRKLLSERRV